MLQGYKTVIFNIVAFIALWLNNNFGIEIPEADYEAIVATVVIVGNLIIRIFFTKSPAFKKQEK